MKKIFSIIVLLLLCSSISFAVSYSTTVSSTGVVDHDGFTWINGTFKVDFVLAPNTTSFSGYTWKGGAFQQEYKGTLDGSGAFSIALPSNNHITPLGSKWRFTICPHATTGCFTYTAAAIESIQDITTAVNAVAVGPRFNAGMYNYGYGPIEVNHAINPGTFFYNTTTNVCEIFNGASTWVACNTGGTVAAYGEIILTSNATATTLTTENTWYVVNPATWAEDLTPVGMTTQLAAGTITSGTTGNFQTLAAVAFTSGAAPYTIQFGIFKNGTLIPDHVAVTWTDTTTYPNTVTLTGIEPLVPTDVIDLRARCVSTGCGGITITVTDANFNVAQI